MSASAVSLISHALSSTPPSKRLAMYQELLAHIAAGLVIIEGSAKAAESLYRAADAVVDRSRE